MTCLATRGDLDLNGATSAGRGREADHELATRLTVAVVRVVVTTTVGPEPLQFVGSCAVG